MRHGKRGTGSESRMLKFKFGEQGAHKPSPRPEQWGRTVADAPKPLWRRGAFAPGSRSPYRSEQSGAARLYEVGLTGTLKEAR